ncbi:MAG: glycosyl hydrolase [Thermoprotei archaeon]
MFSEDLFKNPPKWYRGFPFLSINDKLDPRELRKQVGLLDDAGYGGAFFHAREGLLTPFLGDEWFKAFRSTLEEASDRSMYMWAYDEDKWPSGSAGGLVSCEDPSYRAKALLMVINGLPFAGEGVIAQYRSTLRDGLPADYEKTEESKVEKDCVYLSFIEYESAVGDSWFNGLSYVDLLNPRAVDEFIRVAYKPYADLLKEYGDKVMPGIFTDEPNLTTSVPSWKSRSIPPRGAPYPIYSLPWTDEFPSYFKELNGYDIIEKLPELFFDLGSFNKTRLDYWKTLTSMFVQNFSKKIFDWCSDNGLKFTGHYLMEDNLISQLVVGSVMPHYEYEHVPGIDHLCNQIWNGFLTAKQVASVANQLGKERVLSETYGATGVHTSFEDRKWIGDFLYALGVNLLNLHLIPYSMRGRRKYDFGLIAHPAQPWWRYNRVIEDYFARLSYALSAGSRISDVLVIHPMASVWASYTPVNSSEAEKINASFMNLIKKLAKIHVDFELGDEMLLAKYGKVAGNRISVGRANYGTVIIPPSYTISSDTLYLLDSFAKNGGLVIAVKPLPTMVDGTKSDRLSDFLSKVQQLESIEDLNQAMSAAPMSVTVESSDDEDGDVLLHARKINEAWLLFVVNTNKTNGHRIKVGIKGSFSVRELDAMTGSTGDYPGVVEGGKTLCDLELEPVGSKLLLYQPGSPVAKHGAGLTRVGEIRLDDSWELSREDPNVLVLDYARVKGESSWGDLMPVYRAKNALVDKGLGSKFAVRFEANVTGFSGKAYLAVEKNSGLCSLTFNGVRLDLNAQSGEWIDWNFAKYDVTNYLKTGVNFIDLEGTVTLEPELEPVFLLGDFEVKANARATSSISEERHGPIELGDITGRGYPFYSGTIRLTRSFNLSDGQADIVKLRLKFDAALAIVHVNGNEVKKVIHPSELLDISEYVTNGGNELVVELVGTLGNSLGPLHRKLYNAWPEGLSCVGPEAFYAVDQNWTDEYVLKPFGIKSVTLELYKKL